MKITRWLLLAALVLSLAACSSSQPTKAPSAPTQPAASVNPKELIAKKWQRTDAGKETEKVEFAADGTFSGDSGGFPYKGKYRFLDNDTIECELKPDLGPQQYNKCTVKVTADELTLKIVDAKSRKDDTSPWQKEANDRARIDQVERYKRQP